MFNFFNKSSTRYFVSIFDTAPDEVESEIESLSTLPNGWHFGEGVSPSKETIYFAKEIYRECKDIDMKSKAFPSIHGGVVLTFYGNNDHCLEISIAKDNSMSISYEIGHGFDYTEDFYQENATINDAKQQCKKLSVHKKINLSELSIRDYLIMIEEGLPATASKFQPATEGFPLWIDLASIRFTTPRFVNM